MEDSDSKLSEFDRRLQYKSDTNPIPVDDHDYNMKSIYFRLKAIIFDLLFD